MQEDFNEQIRLSDIRHICCIREIFQKSISKHFFVMQTKLIVLRGYHNLMRLAYLQYYGHERRKINDNF